MGTSIGGLWGTIYIIFMAGIVLFLAYIVTRFIGSKYMKTLKGKNITVIESVTLGIDKVLYIVRIGEQYFLISSSGKNINFLSEIKASNISKDSQEIITKPIIDNNGFAKYLDMFKNNFPNNKSDVETEQNDRTEDIQQYISKENVQKVDRNVEKIREIFNNIKVSDKDGVE